ncbi:PAS domain S-box protein [Magnetococcales bacterium HHB-1]
MSFRLKTIIGIALIEGLLLAVLIVGVLELLSRSSEQQLMDRLTTTTSLFSSSVKDHVISYNLAALASHIKEIIKQPDMVYIRVFDADKRILIQKGAPDILQRPFQPDKTIDDVDDDIYDIRTVIEIAKIPYGWVEMGLDIRPLQKAQQKISHHSLLIAGIEMGLVALFSFILGTYLTRQLHALKEGSRAISSGKLGIQIPVHGNDELATTAIFFNHMSLKVAEDAAKRDAVMQTALDAIVVTDIEGRILEFNPAAERTFGFTREEIIGRSLTETIIPERYRQAHQQGVKRFKKDHTLSIEGRRIEIFAQHADGHEIPVEAAIGVARVGDDFLFTGYLRDITQKRASEEHLRKLSRAVEQSPASIIITDREGTIEFVNAKFVEITGYSYEETIGENPRILKSGQTPEERYNELWHTITQGQEWSGEFVNKKKNGEIYREWASISPIRHPDGSINNYLAVKENITEYIELQEALIQAKEAAEQANRAKSTFLATMSHEIRTPLNAILGMGELLGDTTLTKTQSWCVRTLQRSGETLLTLINDILDLSKIEAGQLKTENIPFNLRESIAGTMAFFILHASEKGLRLSHIVNEEAPYYVKGDPIRLRQILINLVGNAVKFTETGEITVNVRVDTEQRILFEVKDSGPGIPIEQQEIIFQAFTQADSTITRNHGGTGLGLTICRKLVGLLGGHIELESTPGKGSTFRFMIPMSPVESHDLLKPLEVNQNKQSSEAEQCTSRQPLSILLVDDSEDNRLLVKAFLRKLQYQLTMAKNGTEAVAKFKEEKFNLVLMDIQMPIMDGYEATRQIRALEANTNAAPTPIVALTAHALSEESEEIMAAGCDLHLTKPIGKKRLLETIDRYTKPKKQ